MVEFVRRLEERPVIAAARDMAGVLAAAQSKSCAVFVLGGSILQLPDMVRALRDAGKTVFLHLDLVDGLGRDQAAVEWCARFLQPDGLISTRAALLKAAKAAGLITIQRLFVTDSSALAHGVKQLGQSKPDLVEILPGLVPKAIAKLRGALPGTPIIAGGMVTEQTELEQALGAGAVAVSTSVPQLWGLTRSSLDAKQPR